MTNTSDIMTSNYNLSGMFSETIIEHPEIWLATFNEYLNYWPIVALLAVFGAIVAITLINLRDTGQAEAIAYGGIVSTFAGIIVFVVQVSSGIKLITWPQLLPFVVITAIAILAFKANQTY